MNKRNFLWCLARTKGRVRLKLGTNIDRWTYTYRDEIECMADIETPPRDENGKGICSTWKLTFAVVGFLGGNKSESAKNEECDKRANLALAKYSRWARQAIGDRFIEPTNTRKT